MIRLLLEEEQVLWDQFRAGEKTAFEKLMQAHYRALFHYGAKFHKDSEFIKDCIQELFLELWKNRATLGTTNFPKSYLLKSLRRKIHRDLHKNRWHIQAQPLEETATFDVEFSVENQFVREQTVREMTNRLTYVLNQLPQRQKEVIYLRFYQELEIEQIVQVMEVNPQSVYNLLHKALGRLREYWPSETVLLFILLSTYLAR